MSAEGPAAPSPGHRDSRAPDRPADAPSKAAAPLEGEPLLWGRVEGGGLSVYRLAVSREGRPTLDRYTFRPADPGAEGLAFAASRLGPGGETVGGLRAALGRATP